MLNTILPLISLGTTISVLFLAWRFFHNAPPWLDEKIESTLSVFLEPDKDGRNMVDLIGDRLGRSIKGGLMGHRSVEVRHQKAIETRVFEAVKNNIPEVKVGLKLAEKFGLGDLVENPEDAYAVMQVLQKYGIDLGGFLKPGQGQNNPGSRDYGGKM